MTTIRGEISINHIDAFFTATSSVGITTGAAFIAASTGKKIHITDVIISGLTTGSITLREDTSTGSFLSVDMGFTPLLGGTSFFSHSFLQPIILNTSKPLQFTSTANLKISVSGYYK